MAAALARVERGISKDAGETEKSKDASRLRSGDVLLVPEMLWQASQRFSEIEGSRVRKGKLQHYRIEIARQDIRFRVDRHGADLSAESVLTMRLGLEPGRIPRHFILEGPFLIYMRQREVPMPYFAAWVDNAELLQPWRPNS